MNKLSFSIDIDSSSRQSKHEAFGIIEIDDFKERFTLALGYWNTSKYRMKWKEALETLIEGAPAVALMTWMARPGTQANLRAWILYRQGTRVFVHEHLYPAGEHSIQFNDQEQILNIPERTTVTEDGNKVSVWKTNIEAIKDFIKRSR